MMQTLNDAIKGVNVVIKIGENILGGQTGAKLTRNSLSIDITNKINSNWKEVLPGTKSWQVQCNGTYLKNSAALQALEEAYLSSKDVTLIISIEGNEYEGAAIITAFPLNATYNNAFTYSITFLGNGPIAPKM